MKRILPLALIVAALSVAAGLQAQQPLQLETGYQLPPKVIVDILDAPPPGTVPACAEAGVFLISL